MVLGSLRTLRKRSIHAYDALIFMYDCPVQHAPTTYKFTGKERGLAHPCSTTDEAAPPFRAFCERVGGYAAESAGFTHEDVSDRRIGDTDLQLRGVRKSSPL